MMRRIVIISVLTLAGLVAALALAASILLQTESGRRVIASIAERELVGVFGGEARIGALEGVLPAQIVARDIVFSEDGETWLAVERIEIDWRPFRLLLRGDIDIERLSIIRPALYATPPARPREEPADRVRAPLRLPELPRIAIRSLAVENGLVEAGIAGEPAAFSATGALAMGGEAFRLTLLAQGGDTDILNARIVIDPAAERLVFFADAHSRENGIIATLAGLGGALDLTARGDGEPDAFGVRIDTAAGAYGTLGADAEISLQEAPAARLAGAFAPGAALADLAAELGPEIAFDLRATFRDEETTLAIDRLESAAGDLAGRIVWRERRGALDRANFAFDARLAQGFRTDIQSVIGDALAVEGRAQRRGADYAVEGEARSGRFALRVFDARSDLRARFNGRAQLDFEGGADMRALLRAGAGASAQVEARGAAVTLRNLVLGLGDMTVFTGEAEGDLETRAFALSGTGALTQGLLAAAGIEAEISRPGRFQLEAQGTLDRFAAVLELDTPDARVNGARIPASTLVARAAGLPGAPSGDISAEAVNEPGALEAQFRSAADGAIAIPALSYRGAQFRLDGSGAIDAAREGVEIDLVYEGDAGAQPLPGFPLEGRFTLAGAIARNEERNDLRFAAPALDSEDFALRQVEARLAGPSRALSVTASAQAVRIEGAGTFSDVTLSGIADLREQRLALAAFEADYERARLVFSETARFSFSEGIAIENLRARYGRRGAIAADATLARERWRAVIDVADAPFREGAADISFTLDLDTDRAQPGAGGFRIQSGLVETEDAVIAGDFVWNGAQLRLFNADRGDAAQFEIALPLALMRRPSVRFALDGAIEGFARYDGALEPFALYLPTDFQSLEGRLAIDLRLSGVVAAPVLEGRIDIADGAYTEFGTGLSLVGIHAAARASASAAGSSVAFSGGARGPGQTADTIVFSGEASVTDTVALDASAEMTGLRVSAEPVTDATFSGTLRLRTADEGLRLDGDVAFAEVNAELNPPETTGLVDIAVVAVNGENGMAAEVVPPGPPGTRLDIRARADDRIFVRGRGLESEWRADIRVQGDTQEPLILGELTLRRGFLDFAGRRFTIARGRMTFDRLNPNNPVLDIRAEYATREGVVAAIEMRGRAAAPNVRLVSTPARPPEDVMALVLFGKPATQLTALESLQIAQALASLGGVGGFGGDPTGFARRALGLDLLTLDFDPEAGGGSLAIGKYVTEGLFVSATQDARGERGSVRLQYEITDSITVETEILQDGNQRASVNWKRDF